ncbi:MAG: hypothetical protein H8D45_22705 [Bacteroidetes bacterium]|nr:hypothetical protein [Bacteroidota bacterium]
MKEPNRLPIAYSERISEILDISWCILKSRFIEGRHIISKEAPFQHYFAHIISTIGEIYCTKRSDIFMVDLETKLDDVKGKSKYIDITCSFPNEKVSCAIELKFKTAKQGAQDHGRIDAFVDIEALEIACRQGYSFGKFYMITNSTPYVNKSKIGVGTAFTTHDGAVTPQQHEFHCPNSKGREHIIVNLSGSYSFQWENIGDWYFLELNINGKQPTHHSSGRQTAGAA